MTGRVALLILIVAALIRLVGLGSQSLWVDEAYAVLVAQRSIPEIVRAQIGDSSPPLYYLLLHGWGRLFGWSEFALRLLSAVAGTVTVGLVLGWLSRQGRPRQALIAGGLLAVWPLHLQYSQEARMYALFALVHLGSWILLDRWLHGRQRRDLIGWGVLSVGCFSLHVYGLFVLLCQGGWALYRLRREADHRRRFLRGLGVVAVVCSPWLVVVTYQVFFQQAGWIPSLRLHDVYQMGLHLSGLGYRTPHWPLRGLLVKAALAVTILLTAWSLWTGRKDRVQRLAALGMSPLVLALAVSTVVPVFIPGRYEVAFVPFYLMMIAGGIVEAGRRFKERALPPWLLLAGVAPAALVVLLEVGNVAFAYEKSNDRDYAREIVPVLAGVDQPVPIVVEDLNGSSLRYYLDRWGMAGEAALIPVPGDALGWVSKAAMEGHAPKVDRVTDATLERVQRLDSPVVIYAESFYLDWAEGIRHRLAQRYLDTSTIELPPANNPNQIRRLWIMKKGQDR